MKKRLFDIFPLIIVMSVLVLEMLPFSVVLYFGHVTENGEVIRSPSYYSHFDLIPFGNAHFTPLIIGILTCVLLILCMLKFFAKKANNILDSILIISLIIVFLSIIPMILGMGITIINIIILILISILSAQIIYQKHALSKINTNL